MLPTTRKVLRRGSNGSLDMVVEPLPPTGATDALIRVKAVALNWKDAAMLNSKFPWPNVLEHGIHGSEFAGEIVALGDRATSFQVRRRKVFTWRITSLKLTRNS